MTLTTYRKGIPNSPMKKGSGGLTCSAPSFQNKTEGDTMSIWERNKTPDPKYVKEFNRGGGFKGSATNTQYMIQRATEEFGPNGIGWGVDITDEQYVPGGHLTDTDKTIIHVVRGYVWYMQEGTRYQTSEQFGQTTFVGKNKYGVFTDEEAPKKSVTDMMLKCLSLLGFSADIFLGHWDDNKYVNDVRKQFDVPKQKKQQPPENVNLDPDTAAGLVNHIVKLADGIETEQGLKDLYNDNKAQIERLPDGQKADLLAYLGERKAAVLKVAA
jgi:hypothetical protein